MFDLVVGHTSFLGHTGYANHAREFFCSLNEQIPVRVRNFCHVEDIGYLTQTQKDMVIKQTWSVPPYELGSEFDRTKYQNPVNIVLLETNHFYFYEDYQGPKIAYNVWESTRQPQQFFDRLLQFDQMWVPSWWQRKHTIEQGYPEDSIFVVPEGVDGTRFKPRDFSRGDHPFRFMIFGRWDYRKGILESVRAFVEEFKHDDGVELLLSVDNPFPTDGLSSTEERLERYGLQSDKIKIVHFPPDEEYVRLLQTGDVFVSCARSEGWNLPLMEAMACGTVAICSNCSAQLDFARGIAHLVDISHMAPPKEVFMQDKNVPGFWYEPDFEHLKRVMRECYVNHEQYKERALWGADKLRERYTWQNATNAAMEALGVLDKQLKPHQPVRLNVGCGDRRFDGYLSVDKYYPGVDIQRDASDLGFDDDSVEEIKSFHMLEHLSKFEVGAVLKEWYRVLRPGGELWLNIPDLEWCLLEWIKTPEKDKLGHSLDRVFGLQNKPGEEHKCGYTKGNITSLLEDFGFVVDKCEQEWMGMYNQQCLDIRAHKPKNIPKEVVVIGGYIDTTQKEKILLECYNNIKSSGLDVCFVGHYPLKPDIAKLFDYVLYEQENILSAGWDMTWWYATPNGVKLQGKYGDGTYQPVAILNALNTAFKTLVGKYDVVHYVESDLLLDFTAFLHSSRKYLMCGKRFVGFAYVDNKQIPGLCSGLFSVDIKWALSSLPRYGNFDEYLNKAVEMQSDCIFELWLKKYLDTIGQTQACEFMSYDEYYKVIKNGNAFVRERKDDVKIALSETDKDEVVVFIVGFEGKETNDVDCVVKFNGNVLLTDTFKRGDCRWTKFPKEAGLLEVAYNGYVDVFTISPGRQYLDVMFEFPSKEVVCKLNAQGVRVSTKYTEGATVEITGTGDEHYKVSFVDTNTNKEVFADVITPGHWTRPYRKWYTDWHVEVRNQEGKICLSENFDLKDKRVLVGLGSSSLGDSLAWVPYIEEFRKLHNCNVIAATWVNDLVRDAYPEIEFVAPGSVVYDIYARYEIGCYDNDFNRNKTNWRLIPVQRIASDVLGLDYKETRPKLSTPIGDRPIEEKYFCLAEHSTLQCKYWNRPNGWQDVVDWLVSLGYKVVVVSKEPTGLSNIVDRTNRHIFDTITTLKHSEGFFGVSSGLAWVSWALEVPVVMVSGFTQEWNEFTTGIARVINKDVCHGCINHTKYPFERGNWNWCPREKSFECSREISADTVIQKAKEFFGL